MKDDLTSEFVAETRDIRLAEHDVRLPAPGSFDLILCRNILMYFPLLARTHVFDHLADALKPGGILMLGAGETVLGQTERFLPHPAMRGLYAAAPEVSRSPARAATR
ncbi:MAG: CheR family methyltransferase [Sphingomonas sp.]|jgi:chemotaxis protein methyltransferase CheR